MIAALAAFFAGLGAIVGSFLNVIIYRLPRDEPMRLMGRSQCPSCRTTIAWHDNVPLLSFLALRGRCRACRWPIPVRYPLVEAITAGLFALALVRGAHLAWSPLLPAVLLTAAFSAVLVAASFIDIDHRILPDALTLRAGPPIALLASLVVPSVHGVTAFGVSLASIGKPGLASLLVGLAGAIVGGGVILLIRFLGGLLLRKEAMGLGDVKLMALSGLMLGPEGALLAIGVALVLGSALGIAIWILTRKREVPFGPFLAAASLALLFFDPEIRHLVLDTYPRWIRG